MNADGVLLAMWGTALLALLTGGEIRERWERWREGRKEGK